MNYIPHISILAAAFAVGMGAISNELRRPYLQISFLSPSQSYLKGKMGVVSHKSYCNNPSDAGDPSNVSYAPYCFANSHDSVNAA